MDFLFSFSHLRCCEPVSWSGRIINLDAEPTEQFYQDQPELVVIISVPGISVGAFQQKNLKDMPKIFHFWTKRHGTMTKADDLNSTDVKEACLGQSAVFSICFAAIMYRCTVVVVSLS